MKKANKIIISVFLFMAGVISAFTLDIKGTAPQFIGDSSSQTVVDALNGAVTTAFDTALDEIRKQIGGIDTKPEAFIQSWGSSQVFASQGTPGGAYGDYKLFSFSLNPVIGVQFPGDPLKIADDFNSLTRKLNEDRDIKLGVSPQLFNARIGINTSKFLLDRLYLGLQLGLIKLNGDDFGFKGFNYDNFTLGATANYQLVHQKSFAGGLLGWRGVNVGAGFIYTGTKIAYSLPLGRQEQSFNFDISGTTVSSKLTVDPRVILDMDISTFTIPLEVTTAVRLLWFLNFTLGVGADIGFGKSDVKFGMEGDIGVGLNVSGMPQDILQSKPGSLSVSAGGDMPPSFLNPKLMTGVGLNFGPLVIDVPITLYLDNGYSIGVMLGVFW